MTACVRVENDYELLAVSLSQSRELVEYDRRHELPFGSAQAFDADIGRVACTAEISKELLFPVTDHA